MRTRSTTPRTVRAPAPAGQKALAPEQSQGGSITRRAAGSSARTRVRVSSTSAAVAVLADAPLDGEERAVAGMELEQLVQHGTGSPRGSPQVRRRPSPSHAAHRAWEEQVPPARWSAPLPPGVARVTLVDAGHRTEPRGVDEDQPGPADARDQAALLEITDHAARHLP